MPLIIIILLLTVAVLYSRERERNALRERDQRVSNSRRTNAKLERLTVDKYMKQGCDFNEAFEKARQEMISLGFCPCIPRTAYDSNSSYCKQCEKFDSSNIKSLRLQYEQECRAKCEPQTFQKEQDYIYGGKSKKYRVNGTHVARVGQYIMYMKTEQCEVVELDFDNSEYVVVVVSTGESKRIKFLDPLITRLD